MDKTIIAGNIEFLNRGIQVRSIDEVYKVGSKEEQEAIESMLGERLLDWVVLQDYKGTIEVTNSCLLTLLGCVKSSSLTEG